jgi:hypothetical protein
MRVCWRLILPLIGLTLFAAETRRSLSVDREIQRTPGRYFWWSSIPLDSNPLNEPASVANGCEGIENCTTWDLKYIYVSPGVLTKFLIISAFPAFLACALTLVGLRRFGINEFWGFMVCMPVLLLMWYYFLGWILDRRKNKKAPNRSF